LLENVPKGQWGEVDELPKLNAAGAGRNYGQGSFTYNDITYYYISFDAKFGDDISELWPCGVFESVTRVGKINDNKWSGEEAFVSAWNGEHHVKYSQDNVNETIKGVYERLDENLLFHPKYQKDEDGTVSYLCFWENGANGVGWNTPELYRYNIYLQTYSGMDLSGKTIIERETETGETITYYLADVYDTCDNSNPGEQTQVALHGYQKVTYAKARDGYQIYEIRDSNPKQYFEYKSLDETNDDTILQDPNRKQDYYDSRLYKEGYAMYFYYNANQHTLSFWNYDDHLVDGGGSKVSYQEPLRKYMEGITVGSTEYEGASDIVVKPEKYPASLEPGAYEFEGWYTSPNFEADTKVDPETAKMPDEPLILYAHWIPVTRTVKFFLTKDSMLAEKTIPEEMKELWEAKYSEPYPDNSPYNEFATLDPVPNGSYLPKINTPGVAEGSEYEAIHPRKGYHFVGWFYENEEGKETAFVYEHIPVTQDLELYAKWTTDIPYRYTVYFALDNDNDGKPDVDANGNYTYVAEPVTGSSLAGRTQTFSAKGGDDLYQAYREEYFPTASSHSLLIQIPDENGTVKNEYIFLYQQREAMPYKVRYLDEDGKALCPDVVVEDNKKIAVTEYFKFFEGYMPDAYQKTLTVTTNEEDNVIIFRYTKDAVHSVYAVNHYIQELNDDLTLKGWKLAEDLQGSGKIGDTIPADAIEIPGFTLSEDYTNGYNNDGISGYDESKLPAEVSKLTGTTLSGTLGASGLELNFYYTRNLYPYEFRYMLKDTNTVLKEPDFGKGAYDTYVTMEAGDISIDLDGDGNDENFRLYDPVEKEKSIHIIADGDALDPKYEVKEGDAKLNVSTFFYVRTTRDMTITKWLKATEGTTPDPDQEFTISLKIHATNGYHRNEYEYTKTGGETGILTPVVTDNSLLLFTLKAGQSITIKNLPTAQYTVSELNMPVGYYAEDLPKTYTLSMDTVPEDQQDKALNITVTNVYEPAALEISKTVEDPLKNKAPLESDFTFTVEFPGNVTPEASYAYTVQPAAGGGEESRTAQVKDSKLDITLKHGQVARFDNLPLGDYKVTESSSPLYKGYVRKDDAEFDQKLTETIKMARNETHRVDFKNEFLTQDLTITRKNASDPDQVFVYQVQRKGTDEVYTVTVRGADSTTIQSLPLGDYTVTQMNDWSWRYGDISQEVSLNEESSADVTFGADVTLTRWLDGCSNRIRNWKGGRKNDEK